MIIEIEQPQHAAAIDGLLDLSFGSNRHGKTVYRLREGVAPIADLCLVAVEDGRVEGSIRYWPVLIGGVTPALLLGPIAIAPHRRGEGLGGQLIRQSLNRAAAAGHRIVLLVGDAPYYNKFGFTREGAQALSLPGPVDLERFLALDLVPGALDGVSGMVGRGGGESPLCFPVPFTATVSPRVPGSVSEFSGYLAGPT